MAVLDRFYCIPKLLYPSIYVSKGLGIYCLAVEAGFYSDVVECLPVNPATWVRFPAGVGKIFSLYDICLGVSKSSFRLSVRMFVRSSVDTVLVNVSPVMCVGSAVAQW